MLLSSLAEKRAVSIDPKHPGDPALVKLLGMFGRGESDTGLMINADNAPETDSVMACVKVISETLASCPLNLLERVEMHGREGKVKARAHSLFDVLRYQPNPWQSAYEFKELIGAHLTLRGNFYAEKEFDKGGNITGLYPRHPDRVTPFMVNGQRAYRYQPASGEQRVLLQSEMFHVPGLSFDGFSGLDPIAYARNAIGLARATEKFGGSYFANGTITGLVIEYPGRLSDEGAKNLRESVEARLKGPDKAHKPIVLEDGVKIHELGIAPDNAQFIETRKHQRNVIAGYFRVPPPLIGDLDRATFSNIDKLIRAFIDLCMLAWFTRIEQAGMCHLLTREERRRYLMEFNPAVFLRGDMLARYQAYRIGREMGTLSPNDIREKENENPIENGDSYLQPLNMAPLGTDLTKNETDSAEEDDRNEN